MADPFNHVAQGREGTGAAFLLSGNRAAEIFQQNIKEDEQQRRLAEFQRQKALRDQQAANSKFLSDVKVGDHWQNDNKYIQKAYDDNMAYASGLKLQNKDIVGDETFRSNNQKNLAMADFSKKSETEFNKFYTEYSKNPSKVENADEIIAWYTRPLPERMASGVLPPKPIIKHTLSDAIKESDGKVSYVKNNDGSYDTTKINRSGIIDQAIGSLDGDAAKYLIGKKGGDTSAYTGGFPSVLKDGKRLWETSGDQFESSVERALATDPSLPEYLQSKGYDVSTPDKIFESAKDFAAKQNKATGSYVQEYVDKVSGAGTTDTTRVFTARADARAERTANRLEAKEDAPDQVSTYRQNWINELFDGVPGSGERLIAAVKGNGSYNGELKIQRINSQPNKIVFRIPGKKTTTIDQFGDSTTNTTPERTVTFDKNNANDKIAMNQLLNEITKENVNVSQLMTEGGKKKVVNGMGVTELNKPGKTDKKAQGGYKIGQVDGGYKYTGGDPTKPENWVKQ